MEAVAQDGVTVILSSHIVADLERRLRPPRDPLPGARAARRTDRRDRGRSPAPDGAALRRGGAWNAGHDVIRARHTDRQTTLLVRARGHVYDAAGMIHPVDLEEIVLAYLSLGAAPAGDAPSSRLRGGRLVTWLAWRQQRTETLIAIAMLAALAALLIPTGIEMANAYHHDGLSVVRRPQRHAWLRLSCALLHSRFGSLGNIAAWFTLIPGLLGALLAAPFVLDLENGTFRLVWTQSITRGRWVASQARVHDRRRPCCSRSP